MSFIQRVMRAILPRKWADSMEAESRLSLTLPYAADEALVSEAIRKENG